MGLQVRQAGLSAYQSVQNYFRDLGKNQFGGKWRLVFEEIGESEVQFCRDKETGRCYPNDSYSWVVAKNVAAVAMAYPIYVASSVMHIGKGVCEYWESKDIGRLERHAKSAAKTGAIAAVLWFDPCIFGIGCFGYGVVSLSLVAYAIFNSFEFRQQVEEIGEWCRNDKVEVFSEEERAQLSVGQTVLAVLEGSYPISDVLKMGSIAVYKMGKKKQKDI